MRSFGEAQSKATRAYAQSGQYHTIVQSRVHLTSISSRMCNIKPVCQDLSTYPIFLKWSDDRIHSYVPESARRLL